MADWLPKLSFVALMALFALGACVLVASVQQYLERLIATAVAVLREPLAEVRRHLEAAMALPRRALAATLAALAPAGAWPGEPLIGGCLYLAAFVVMLLGDLGVLLLTFQAMGMGHPGLVSPGAALAQAAGLDLLSALAFLGTAALYGLVLLDLSNITHFGPWHRARGVWRRAVIVLAVAGLAGALALGAALGTWRAAQLLQVEADAQLLQGTGQAVTLFDRLGFFLAGVLLPPLLMLGLALGGWSLAWPPLLGWLLALAAIVILLTPLCLLARLVASPLEFLGGLLVLAVQAAGHVGRTIWNWLTSFEALRRHLHLGPMQSPQPPAGGIQEVGELPEPMGDGGPAQADAGAGGDLEPAPAPGTDGAGRGGRRDLSALW